ncbi:MAG: NnrS family protein [Rhodanobacteraceae bacterium]
MKPQTSSAAPEESLLPAQPYRLLFLCAALFASLGMLAWGAFLHIGWLPSASLLPIPWHAHAMLYGFAGALVGGFVLTAAATWTAIPTITHRGLWMLVAAWAVARLALLTQLPCWIGALFDIGYLLALALLLARVIWLSRNTRNAFIVGILLVYAGLDVAFYFHATRIDMNLMSRDLIGTADLLVLLMLAMGGRVIPFFTSRKLSGHVMWTNHYLEWIVNAGGALVLVLGLFDSPLPLRGVAMIAAALLAALRLIGWRGWRAWREPMLWVLHVGYLWLAVGLAIRGLALIGWLQMSELESIHGLTVGALGTLSIGMMARVSLGHGGANIHANPGLVIAFVLPSIAAIVRLACGPSGWIWAASLWVLAFLVFLGSTGPLLLRARRVPTHA